MSSNVEIYNLLKYKKIEFNWNKHPIKIEDFLNMITIPVESNTECLGYYNGWRSYENKDHNLIIRGGIVSGHGCLLESIQYGKNLNNPYNNYVNPFLLNHILSNDGHNFFIEYYKDDIMKLIEEKEGAVDFHAKKLASEKETLSQIKFLLKARKEIKP